MHTCWCWLTGFLHSQFQFGFLRLTDDPRTEEQNHETGGDEFVSQLVFFGSIPLTLVVVLLLFDLICILLRVSVRSF